MFWILLWFTEFTETSDIHLAKKSNVSTGRILFSFPIYGNVNYFAPHYVCHLVHNLFISYAPHQISKDSDRNQIEKRQSSFFQNEDIFLEFHELDELDRITHAWIGFHYSLTEAQKTF